MVSQKDKRTRWTKEDLGIQEEKKQELARPSLPRLLTIEESLGSPEQCNLSPLLPQIGRSGVALLSPPSMLSHSLYLGYKNGPRTHVQCWLSQTIRKPAHCAKRRLSLPHPNKLYSPLILPHVWNSFPTLAWTTTKYSRSISEEECLLSKHFITGMQN